MRLSVKKYWLPLLLPLLLVISGCQTSNSPPIVSLKPTDYSHTNPLPINNPNVLKVGLSSVLSPREAINNYQAFVEYLQTKTGRPVQLVQRQTYQEMNDLVRDGEVDVALICSGAYVIGKNNNMELLVVPEVNGKSTYQSYIIVNENSKFMRFEDLKGQVFAFTDPISFSGTIAPTYMVSQLKSKPSEYFGRVIYTYSHDNSIKAVLDSVVSAAAVDSFVFQYIIAKDPTIANKLRIIARSPEVGSPPVVVNSNIDPHLKTVLLEAMLQMDNDQLGKKALDALVIDRFVLPDNTAYKPIEIMLDTINR